MAYSRTGIERGFTTIRGIHQTSHRAINNITTYVQGTFTPRNTTTVRTGVL